DEIWGDRFVSDSALTSRIKSVRRAVGDTGRDQRIIRTIHGRGYRFVAEVVDGAGPPPAEPDPGAARPEAPPARDDEAPPAVRRALRALADLAFGAGVALRVVGGSRDERTDVLHTVADAARRRSFAVGLSAARIEDGNPFACIAEALDEMTH